MHRALGSSCHLEGLKAALEFASLMLQIILWYRPSHGCWDKLLTARKRCSRFYVGSSRQRREQRAVRVATLREVNGPAVPLVDFVLSPPRSSTTRGNSDLLLLRM